MELKDWFEPFNHSGIPVPCVDGGAEIPSFPVPVQNADSGRSVELGPEGVLSDAQNQLMTPKLADTDDGFTAQRLVPVQLA